MGKTTEMTSKRASEGAGKQRAKPGAGTRKATRRKAAAAKKRTTNARAAAAPPKKVIKSPPIPKKKSRKRAATGTGADQRVHRRHDLEGARDVGVELLGYQRDGREFGIGPKPAPGTKFQCTGVTSNLSLSGMLARVSQELSAGSHCLVRFLDAGAGIRPEFRWGLVLRSQALEGDEWEVAIAFDNPLELLDLEALDAA